MVRAASKEVIVLAMQKVYFPETLIIWVKTSYEGKARKEHEYMNTLDTKTKDTINNNTTITH